MKVYSNWIRGNITLSRCKKQWAKVVTNLKAHLNPAAEIFKQKRVKKHLTSGGR